MQTVNGVNGLDTSLYTDKVDQTQGEGKVQGNVSSLPSTSASALDGILQDLELPTLPVSMRGIQIDQIMTALANEARRNGVRDAVDSISTHGDEIKAENDKKLEKIQQEMKKLEKEDFWDGFCKVFKIIGLAFAAVGSIATTAVGVMSGNPALIAAGVVGAVMTIDGIVSVATDGKYSIASGFTALGKTMGMSDEAAKWFGFGMNLAIMLAGIAVSFGASATMSGGKMAESAGQALGHMAKIGAYSNIGAGVSNAGNAVGQIGLAVVQYGLSKVRAEKLDIDAILETLRNNIKMNEELIQVQMDTAEALINDVIDIVNNCEETANTILVASPSVA